MTGPGPSRPGKRQSRQRHARAFIPAAMWAFSRARCRPPLRGRDSGMPLPAIAPASHGHARQGQEPSTTFRSTHAGTRVRLAQGRSPILADFPVVLAQWKEMREKRPWAPRARRMADGTVLPLLFAEKSALRAGLARLGEGSNPAFRRSRLFRKCRA